MSNIVQSSDPGNGPFILVSDIKDPLPDVKALP
jgi:hypothetical protein